MKRVQITLVSDRAHFLASPQLANVATGQEKVSQVTTHLNKLVASPVKIEIDRVIRISPKDKIIHTAKTDLSYDFAIVAAGSTINWRGLDPSNTRVIGCKTATDFLNVNERMRESLQAADLLLRSTKDSKPKITSLCTFVIVGAGPTGISLASKLRIALTEITRSKYPSLSSFVNVVLLDADDRVLTEFPQLSGPVRDELQKIGVELLLKTKVSGFGNSELVFEDATSLGSENIFWCAGVKRHDFFNQPALEQIGDSTLRHFEHREIYIVGDCVDNLPATMNAHCAVAQGRLAASNIVADLAGRKVGRWSERPWPLVIDMGPNTVALNSKGDVLKGRSARIYAKTARAKLLKEWMGGYSTWKLLVGEVLKKTSNNLFLDE